MCCLLEASLMLLGCPMFSAGCHVSKPGHRKMSMHVAVDTSLVPAEQGLWVSNIIHNDLGKVANMEVWLLSDFVSMKECQRGDQGMWCWAAGRQGQTAGSVPVRAPTRPLGWSCIYPTMCACSACSTTPSPTATAAPATSGGLTCCLCKLSRIVCHESLKGLHVGRNE